MPLSTRAVGVPLDQSAEWGCRCYRQMLSGLASAYLFVFSFEGLQWVHIRHGTQPVSMDLPHAIYWLPMSCPPSPAPPQIWSISNLFAAPWSPQRPASDQEERGPCYPPPAAEPKPAAGPSGWMYINVVATESQVGLAVMFHKGWRGG
jgi:hypothetical protein